MLARITLMLSGLLFAAALLLSTNRAHAEDNTLESGDYVVYYNALPSTQLTPDVARNYGITRSASRALLNVSVHRRNDDKTTSAVNALVKAAATNTIGQRQELRPRRVQDGEAIYYLAEARITARDTLLFELNITPDGATQPLHAQFQQEFFPEE
ncbi:MAG: DUF4426 domain-containing protein [Rhodanobacteraceae bacterium]|nr:DUF4426 domain-containing protein [Xanthomonadales bacterium]MCP5479375.1 DUF4426 domain-containing protein [Rhodanobacteraceae bacterium]HPF72636.1 DUF4426 domain-containing protein [Xanthomonadaceae bacterium]HRY00063.1 DUF4426 domain-containing protein [Xanthomonadaceae bacterium]